VSKSWPYCYSSQSLTIAFQTSLDPKNPFIIFIIKLLPYPNKYPLKCLCGLYDKDLLDFNDNP